MSLVEDLHSARKARLVRLGTIKPNRDELIEAIKSIDPVKESAPQPVDAVSEWIDRQVQNAVPIAKEPRLPFIEEIQRATAKHYGVSRIDMHSARRTKEVVKPRQVAMYLCRTMTLRSLPDIGRMFGGKDHTTVMWAVGKIGRLLETDQALAAEIETIKATIAEGIQ